MIARVDPNVKGVNAPLVSFRVPHETRRRVNAYAKRASVTHSAAFRELIDRGLQSIEDEKRSA